MAYKDKEKERIYKERKKTPLAIEERKKYDKEYNLKNREIIRHKKINHIYGLSKEEFIVLEEQHAGKCAICNKKETQIDFRTKKIRSLAIDHCHTTGKVRGLLCKKCNTAIGLLEDSPSLLREALKYLEKTI